MQKKIPLVEKILASVLAAQVLAIVLGSAAAFALKKAKVASGMRLADPPFEKIAESDKNFLSLGKMRLATADSPPVIVVLSPYFRYERGDDAFSDEVLQKKRRISAAVSQYFSLRTRKELADLGEMRIKGEILALVNAELVLGELKDLYFEEFLYVE